MFTTTVYKIVKIFSANGKYEISLNVYCQIVKMFSAKRKCENVYYQIVENVCNKNEITQNVYRQILKHLPQ